MSTDVLQAAPDKASMRKLSHINTPLAQTWNYLRINDVELNVWEPEATGKVYEAVPRIFTAIDAGVGSEATAWITAAAGNARYVEVPRGTVYKEPIVVSPAAHEAQNVAIMVRAGAKATVVVVANGHEERGSTDANNASAALVRIWAERGAQVSISEIVTRTDGQHLEGLGIHAEESARIEVRQYALGGTKTILGFGCNLAGAHAHVDLTCRYHVGANELVDINHLTRMRGQNTSAEMHAYGVLANDGSKTVRQTIDLVHGAKGAQGNESDTTLVTGDDVINKTLPTILCDEEDVAGNHGATIGSVSEEQLAYLEARGLSHKEAEGLFIRAIFDDAILHAPEALSREAAVSHAAAVLGAPAVEDVIESDLESEV